MGGIPDCWYSGDLSDLWAEYKYLPVQQPTSYVIPKLTAQQLFWIRDRKKEGRDIWVIVGCKSGGVILKEYEEMQDGISAKTFCQRILSRKEIALQIHEFCCKQESNNATT